MQKLLVTILIILTSCREKPKVTADKSGGDSTILTIEDVRRNYEATYNKSGSFTGLDEGKTGEEIRIAGKYYSLPEKDLAIPRKLIPGGTQDFITRNFATDIFIISNNDTILKKTISARDFKGNLGSNLSEYGVIAEPVFLGYNEKNDQFDFHFGISIPLTNIAVSRIVGIKRNGELAIKE